MKIIVLKNNLKEGLIAMEKAVIENNALPILKNILLKTFNNRIKIEATNLELGISRYIPGKIIEEGAITVPLDILVGIINNSDSERINLENEKNNFIIKTDSYKARIQGINPEEFPIIPKISNQDDYLEINSELFKKSILKVINCAQISEIRPEISGILFDFQLTIFKLVATDSFRLAEKSIYNSHFKGNFKRGFKVILPLKTAQEIIRVFPNDQNMTIHIDPHQISFKTEDLELISRLIDGTYPDYEQIIPKEIETELSLVKDHFTSALKLVSNFSGRINDISLKLKEGKKILEVYSANQYLGENNYLIPIKMKGKDFKEVKFNWRYLLDGLKNIDSKDIILNINGENRPAIIKSSDDPSYFYVLMPIKI